VIESSLIARLAERAQVPLRVARGALRRWHELSDEERRFLEAFVQLGRKERGECIEAIPEPLHLPIPLTRSA